jgi:hypothetical protein
MKRIVFSSAAVLLVLAPLAGGCASVVGADFDNAVAKPTECDFVKPQSADGRSAIRCGAGETCATGNTGKAVCMPLIDTRSVGDACTYTNECAAGLACTNFGCVAMCQTGTTCADGAECLAFGDGAPTSGGKTYGYCAPASCDPLSASSPRDDLAACASGNCRFVGPEQTVCIPTRAPMNFGSCEVDTDCAAKNTCVDGRCKLLCTIGSTCRNGSACAPGAGDPRELTLGGETYGHCQ